MSAATWCRRRSSGSNVLAACSSFAPPATSANGRDSPVSSAYSSVRASPRRDSEQAHRLVQELVARRAFDRPRAEPLAGLEDLLDPDVRGARPREPGEVLARVRQAVDVVDPQAVDVPSRTSSSAFTCVVSKTASSSTRTPARSPMSKKRRCKPVRVSTSKNVFRSSGSAQNGFSSLVAMWFGTTSSTIPSPAPAQRAQLLLAAERFRDARRIDDVVTVGRASPRLERRGQVEVRDAEVGQVRDELARTARSRSPASAAAGRWRRNSHGHAADPAQHDDRARLDGRSPRARPTTVAAVLEPGSAVESSSCPARAESARRQRNVIGSW